jgi:2-succinyl-5-enolpyruvyl-6-hydroxy-3-cyclohexene-1-carboxylate synthase
MNPLWAAVLVDSCVVHGMRMFFVAPGSRCTPLTLAVAHHRGASTIQHFDERGLAFACLGYGRATNRAGVFVCTSGTAAANAFPAVIEAANDHVPMLLLTADRPPELRGVGANQTIDQVHLFGRYATWFCELPCPTAAIPVRVVAAQVAHAAERASQGPVHLNCMFREPFGEAIESAVDGTARTELSRAVRAEEELLVSPPGPTAAMGAAGRATDCQHRISGGNTLVILGAVTRRQAVAAAGMARRWNCPLLADVTSGLRGLAYDLALVRSDVPAAETVVHVGGRFVSKRLLQFLDRHPPRQLLHVAPRAVRLDPIFRRTDQVVGSVARICDRLHLERASETAFAERWQAASSKVEDALREVLDSNTRLTQPGVVRTIARLLPDNHGLFLGNSLPVREMDMFGFWSDDRRIHVAANRGASGIDGLIASACGFAAGLGLPVTSIVGDLSALHDMNSLAMLRNVTSPFVVIVVNNDGGGIFHFLPVSEQSPHFERYFATPHGLDFSLAAQTFALPYACPGDLPQLRDTYRQALRRPGATILEVKTDRRENVKLHRRIQAAVRQS